jgi:hypothetical protein
MADDPNVQQQATNLLSGIPFSNIIGGPLVAAIDAQGQAAMQTVNFILAVGFGAGDGGSSTGTTDQLQAQMVTFSYTKSLPSGTTEYMQLAVPLLTIVPIPFIRISSMNISFTANIQADTSASTNTTNTLNTSASLSGSANYWFLKTNFNASVSNTNTTNTTAASQYNVQYNMNVNVNAVQDVLPAGLQSVLNILSNVITPTQLGSS